MIDVTTLRFSEKISARALQCFVRKLAIDRYVIKPRFHSKTRRLVTFHLRAGNRLFARCEDFYRPGEQCPANQHNSPCYHVAAALRRAEINARREQTPLAA